MKGRKLNEHKLPLAFKAGGIYCGVKRKRKDLALFFSEVPCIVKAVFTRNTVKAAPVIVAREQLRKRFKFRAVLVNSGNANCMTGKRGIRDTRTLNKAAAEALNIAPEEVIGSSTGIIGEHMPVKTITEGIPDLVEALSEKGLNDAADGIMTTDRFRKISSRSFKVGGKEITVTGVAKGAGMIDPNMATMLCFVMTDAAVTGKAMKKALLSGADTSFNAITVDGDMSTNDTVMIMANGAAGNPLIKDSGKAYQVFRRNVVEVTEDLARMIVRDGEGATKFIEVRVTGAATVKDAKKVADSIGSSMLVKCAVLGGDPNWGRIASSAGATAVPFDTEKITIRLDGVVFFKKGRAARHVDRENSRVFKGKDILIEVDLGMGKEKAVVYSCDISKKYIAFNAFYTT